MLRVLSQLFQLNQLIKYLVQVFLIIIFPMYYILFPMIQPVIILALIHIINKIFSILDVNDCFDARLMIKRNSNPKPTPIPVIELQKLYLDS
jgi:hypothetical protein